MKTCILSLFLSLTVSLTLANTFQKDKDKFVVVLDAGHGGKDPGRPTKHGYKEKNIALKIVLAVGKALQNQPDIEVIYTRDKDVFVELRERAKIANNADADLFISVHCNAHHTQAYGSETYVLGLHANQLNFEVAKQENEVIFLEEDYQTHYEGFDPNSPESLIGLILNQEEYLDQSIMLARLVQDSFKNKLKRKDRGVKQAGFWVLHNTYMPSVLIETGFITNKKEGDYLNSSKGQKDVSTSIIDAISNYKKQLDQNVGEDVYDNEVSEVLAHKNEISIKEIPMKGAKNDSTSEIITEELIFDDVIFKVQIAAGYRKLAPKAYNFNGLKDVSREKSKKLYKYYYGETSDYNKVKRLKEEAKQKGFSSCFIVANKNGKRIALSEVLKSRMK